MSITTAIKLKPDTRIPVLCYHRVLDRDQHAPEGSAQLGGGYGHTWSDQFAEHLHVMTRFGMTAITHEDLIDVMDGKKQLPSHPVLIDFDDNRMAVYTTAWPMMRELGFAGTVFAITELADGCELEHMGSTAEFPAMSWTQLRDLQDVGWAIGGHTKSHYWLKELKEEKGLDEVENEVALGKKRTEEQMGRSIRSFAYPGGSFDDDVERVVKQYFQSARDWHLQLPVPYITHATNRYQLPSANINWQTDLGALADWLRPEIA